MQNESRKRTVSDRVRDAVLAILVFAMGAQLLPIAFAAWDSSKPATNSALVSADIRANWSALQSAIGNPDTTPLTIKQADLAALARFADAPTYQPGASGAYDGTISGLLGYATDSATHGNVGSGETDLSSFSLKAATLSADKKGLRITVFGTLAANANTKTLRMKFGATTLTSTGTTSGGTWSVTWTIIRTGAATQKVTFEGRGISGSEANYSTAAETLSGAITVKTTGQSSAVSNNDIVQEGFIVEVIG